jgi:hypothetical protein
MLSLRFVAEFIEAVTFCHLSESYSTIIDMSAPDARIATLEAQLVECEARAERYRKALHVAAGMPAPAPAPAPAAAAPAKPQVPAKVPEPVESEGELKLINGEFYKVINGNVYEFDQIDERKGDFVGRLKADGESINATAAEVMKGGSRKTRARKGRRSSKNRKTRSRRH